MGPGEIATLVASAGGTGVLTAAVGLPAARVLSRLVLGVGDIGSAYIERPAKLVRAKTERMIEDRASLAAVTRASGVVDPDRAERAVTRMLAQQDRKQANREQIANRAYDDLAADPPKTSEEVSEDFLNSFERIAEDASSEDLQLLFARLLAGECRKPGSYSRAALHFMSLMDKPLAEELESWAGLTFGSETVRFLPAGEPVNKGPRLVSMRRLESLGLLSTGLNIPQKADLTLLFHNRLIWAKASGPKSMPVAVLTPLGMEVFGLIRRDAKPEELATIKTYLGSQGYESLETTQYSQVPGGRAVPFGGRVPL